ncbi:hypothetical protein Pedsa_2612 [Pseudopedobacter saltans DSM 12145]|uniref:DUF983 domain-containing protein n=1 Tax=Pseudopedobacter saltans (strain ATCC 51119 / DSM 12145 / JCM 21818 / CCUG 39354 / LMG 10337 / NBRC 100064 / NCIMB 13643) TaxID=762903 RepID=F0S5J0_PSESL|nr:DUF983 domain-containing protein [Pseudopedobacter saltans]ADY53154.1 hypothetical protein Pedsa_2612 [Pseudopedobacter saltans DSM 12145]
MAATPKLKAMLDAKCPRCRRGDIFQNSMYGLKSQKMYEFCPHCGLKYEVEPGYFYAAMYVGYAINVALGVTVGMATYFITKEEKSPWIYIAAVLTASFLTAPINFRYSRVILLHLLSPKISYRPDYDHD